MTSVKSLVITGGGLWRRASKGCCATRGAKPESRHFALTLCGAWSIWHLERRQAVSLRSVQQILKVHELARDRIRTFGLSKDPDFAASFGRSSALRKPTPPEANPGKS